MADRKRKGKAVATSSNLLSPRFKTLYHESHFNSMLSARRILPELILQADEDVFNPIRYQIYNRKWEKLTKPIQAVGHLMVKEFYANAWEPDKAKRKYPTYTSSVRGTEVSFAPSNIKRVLKLKSDPYPNAPSYHERKANKDYRPDHILEDMCEDDAQWVRHRDGRPHYLRRSDLEPMSKGWYEFICRSILPTTNRSELTVERAMLIHSIIIDENINVEEIIAEQIYKFVYKMDISSSLPFPSIIAALCADAKIRAIPNDTLIPQELPIVAEAMARTREPRARARQATPPQQHPQQPPQFQQQQDFSSTRQFKEMVMQGIPVTMANLAIHRQREKANKGKAREIVPDSEDSEDTFVSSESEEF
ncbi:hypothetical protein PIB30_097809 [Stylosanthes scabra]|uniref:Putative plant transposon protein domain-containing protein n=1 Tax=Stylosanthes scabra TaxID=79078 RepID=A0ABU6SWP9_9FABA|nr:hypothetical protein [Stylosanthes scabra]